MIFKQWYTLCKTNKHTNKPSSGLTASRKKISMSSYVLLASHAVWHLITSLKYVIRHCFFPFLQLLVTLVELLSLEQVSSFLLRDIACVVSSASSISLAGSFWFRSLPNCHFLGVVFPKTQPHLASDLLLSFSVPCFMFLRALITDQNHPLLYYLSPVFSVPDITDSALIC